MKSNFEKAANSLLGRYGELSRKTDEALELSRTGMYEEADAAMADVIRMMEKAALLCRKLPMHTGNPNAQAEVEAILADACPIKMGFIQPGWFFMRMPPLASRKDLANKEYVRGMLYPAMRRFWEGKPAIRMPESVIIYRHMYARGHAKRRKRDYDNVEVKFVTDTLAMYLLEDDSPDQCEVFQCTAVGDEDCLDVFVVPQDYFTDWYNAYKGGVEHLPPIQDTVPSRWLD